MGVSLLVLAYVFKLLGLNLDTKGDRLADAIFVYGIRAGVVLLMLLFTYIMLLDQLFNQGKIDMAKIFYSSGTISVSISIILLYVDGKVLLCDDVIRTISAVDQRLRRDHRIAFGKRRALFFGLFAMVILQPTVAVVTLKTLDDPAKLLLKLGGVLRLFVRMLGLLWIVTVLFELRRRFRALNLMLVNILANGDSSFILVTKWTLAEAMSIHVTLCSLLKDLGTKTSLYMLSFLYSQYILTLFQNYMACLSVIYNGALAEDMFMSLLMNLPIVVLAFLAESCTSDGREFTKLMYRIAARTSRSSHVRFIKTKIILVGEKPNHFSVFGIINVNVAFFGSFYFTTLTNAIIVAQFDLSMISPK